MKKIALFLNGEKPRDIPDLTDYHGIYCTDGAYNFLAQMQIRVDLIVGDFDSLKQLPENIDYIHTPDQDFTDFDKAIQIIIAKKFKQVDVFAANGLEQDHFLGNLTTALKYKSRIKIRFYDDRQSYYFIHKSCVLEDVKGKIISLFPFPKAKGLNTEGLKYPLINANLNMSKNKISTRNFATENQIKITFKKGNVLVFVEK